VLDKVFGAFTLDVEVEMVVRHLKLDLRRPTGRSGFDGGDQY
jgi:hypothetical protein